MPEVHDLREAILERIVVDDNGCWLWQRFRNSKGYGKCQFKGFSQMAHRASYEVFVGPVSARLTLDHLCRNRACVNPAHLEPVPHHENVRRGEGISTTNAAKTHCKNDHPLAGDNLHVNRRGSRVCRTCEREAGVRYRQRLAARSA